MNHINIAMHVYDLFETPQGDLSAHALAEKWFTLFTHWMEKRNRNTPLGEIPEFGYLPNVTLEDGRVVSIMHISAWHIGLLPDDLSFGFFWGNGESKAMLLRTIQENRRHYYVLLRTYADPRNKTDVIWGSHANSFVHEVIHYFDSKRGYDAARDRRLMRTGKEPDSKRLQHPRSYYNDPLELNARFHQSFQNLYQSLVSDIAQRAYYGENEGSKEWFSSFDRFLEKFRDSADRIDYTFLGHLTRRNKQKMVRRLYKLYMLLREHWPNIEEVQQQAEMWMQNWRARDEQENSIESIGVNS